MGRLLRDSRVADFFCLPLAPKWIAVHILCAQQEGRGRRVLDGDGDGDVCKAFIRRDPMIIRDDASFDLEHFSVPNHYRDDISGIMIPFGLLVDR